MSDTQKGLFEMLLLSESDIKDLYTMELAISDLEIAQSEYLNGRVANPHRTVIDFPSENASALYMPSAMENAGVTGVKVVTIFPNNPLQGKKTTQGVLLLSDAKTGDHLACMNASYLTRLRTGAISGIATKYMARENAEHVAVIGCGAMAVEQLEAVLTVRKIKKIYLYNRTKNKAFLFAKNIKNRHPLFPGEIFVVDHPDEAVGDADIIICATRSETPVFSGDSLKAGTHINGVGSYLPHMQEVDETTILKSNKIVVDTLSGVKEEAGEFITLANKGIWSFDLIHGELAQLVANKISGREDDDEITFFKSVGTAYFDLAVAYAVYKQAFQKGVGVEFNL